MNGYLLDTNICVFLFRGKYGIAEKLAEIAPSMCYVSEISIAELKYGAYKSNKVEENLQLIDELLESVGVVAVTGTIDFYAKEKNRLRSLGTPIEDFDLMIAAAAYSEGLTLVTDNTKHFQNIMGLQIENWVAR